MYTPLAAIEPDLKAAPEAMIALVSQMPRDAALLVCGRLNGFVSGAGYVENLERQRNALGLVCTPVDLRKIDAWVRANRTTPDVTVFFRGQLLELMRWIARYGSPGPDEDWRRGEEETRQTFLRAALMASELWGARNFDQLFRDGVEGSDALDRALGAFRKGVEEATPSRHLGVAIGRGMALFQTHLPARLPQFAQAFEAATGMSFEAYEVCAGMVSQYAVATPKESHIFGLSVASGTDYHEIFERFLAAASQTSEELAQAMWSNFDTAGYKALFERPILTTASGRCVVLDPTCFLEAFTSTPFFKLLSGSIDQNTAFGAFGLAFEDYTLDLLRRSCPVRSPLLVQRLFTNVGAEEANPQFEVDAIVNEGAELVVMEVKAVWLRESEHTSDDRERFLAELRNKVATPKKGKARAKGIGQLAKAVRAVVAEHWNGAAIAHDQLKVIYPVLVVHDYRMGSPGIGSFLQRIFRELLGDLGPASPMIAPLTVMTIEDLEALESSKRFTLVELLADYTRQCPDRVCPLHDFMALTGYAAKVEPSQALMDQSFELLATMQTELFPGRDPLQKEER